MEKRRILLFLIGLYTVTAAVLISFSFLFDRAVTAFSQYSLESRRTTVIIDPGHGGEDGGAISCTGLYESSLNLEISLRLQALFSLLGYKTQMIRTTDTAVYTEGRNLLQKKISDLKQRVATVNGTEGGILISIHQNTFPDKGCSGAQVFYAGTSESKDLSQLLQAELIRCLNPQSRRKAKKGDGIYLLEHISCTGVLVECGFLSNPGEEALLRSENYQKKLCGVIAASASTFLSNGH